MERDGETTEEGEDVEESGVKKSRKRAGSGGSQGGSSLCILWLIVGGPKQRLNGCLKRKTKGLR